MQWSDLPFRPSDATLRRFAVLAMLFFGGLAWRLGPQLSNPALTFMLLIGLTIGVLGVDRPQRIRFVFVGWMVAVFPLGWLLSQVALALCYYGIFTPLGLLFRLVGRDTLALAQRSRQSSGWRSRPAPASPSNYFQQF